MGNNMVSSCIQSMIKMSKLTILVSILEVVSIGLSFASFDSEKLEAYYWQVNT